MECVLKRRTAVWSFCPGTNLVTANTIAVIVWNVLGAVIPGVRYAATRIRIMKLRSKAPILRDWQGHARMSTDRSLSPEGRPILVVEGKGPVEPAEAYVFGYEITEATTEELEQLREGRYAIPYMGK